MRGPIIESPVRECSIHSDPAPEPKVVLVAENELSGGVGHYCVDVASLIGKEALVVCLCPSVCTEGSQCWLANRCRTRDVRLLAVPMAPRDWRGGYEGLVGCWRSLGRPLVHVNGRRGNFLSLIAHTRAREYRYVTTVHGILGLHDRRNALYRVVDMGASLAAEAVVAVSADTRRRLVAAGLPSRKVVHIANGLARQDLETLAEISAAKTNGNRTRTAKSVGYLGRLSPEKGIRDYMSVARALADPGRPTSWLVAGGGPLGEWLDREGAELEKAGFLRLLGEIDDVGPFLAEIDVLLMPSANEGLPYSLLEAMAAGCAVVAYGVGGVTEVVSDSSLGCIVRPGDLKGLIANVRTYLNAPGEAQGVGARAATHIQSRYSLDGKRNALLRLYGLAACGEPATDGGL